MTMVMAHDNKWMDELTTEHGRHVDFEDGSYLMRLFESGFQLQKDNQGCWWSTAGWEGKRTSRARRGAERFLEIRLAQAKAAVDDLRQEIESDIAAYVSNGQLPENLEGRKSHLAGLHVAYLAAKEEYRIRIEAPFEERQRRQAADEARRASIVAGRQREMIGVLTSINAYRTDQQP